VAAIVLAAEEAEGAMSTAGIHVSRANRVGSFFECNESSGQVAKCLSAMNNNMPGDSMPKGRSTFTKRQKEHARQQRQRDKAERRHQRRQEKPVEGSVDEMAELREHAAEQAALFNIGVEETETAEESTRSGRIGE
jgi:hypothetical protein